MMTTVSGCQGWWHLCCSDMPGTGRLLLCPPLLPWLLLCFPSYCSGVGTQLLETPALHTSDHGADPRADPIELLWPKTPTERGAENMILNFHLVRKLQVNTARGVSHPSDWKKMF
jgi:hypothetical protein